jgi:tagatose-1,6-bisphosphate aldolase
MTKEERLKKLMTPTGKITIAAIDHRGSLKEELHPENPDLTTESEMTIWKQRMISLYKNDVSGLLIDPIYGKQLIDLHVPCGWMLSMEKTGYRGGKQARETEILDEWDVSQARNLGASGVKLLLYYDPRNQELAAKQREIAQIVAEDCQKQGMVFLLEPLSYGVDGQEREDIVLQTAREIKDIPVDIFKFEYPGSAKSCSEITHIVPGPWVLLSAGMVYDKYREALAHAMEGGASGFAVGRAVWQEFGQYQGQDRERYFTDVALPRMRELVQIVNRES